MSQTNAAATRERAQLFIRTGLLDADLEAQQLAVAIYQSLSTGTPVTKQALAGILDIAPARVETLLADYPYSAIDFDGAGAITAFGGLSLTKTAHEFKTAGADLYTWCVLDALFLPEIIAGNATLRTHCPGSGDEIEVELDPKRIRSHRPEGIVMSIVGPDREACRDDLRGAFCQHVLLFRGESTFREWSQDRDDVAIVSLEEAHTLGIERNACRYPDIGF